MRELNEIDYRALIESSIKDFTPVKRLWPISVRLSLWVLLEVAILGLVTRSVGWPNVASLIYLHRQGFDAAGFFILSIAAASMVLRNSIPGREVGSTELMLLVIGVFAATIIVQIEPSSHVPLSLDAFSSMLARQLSFAALPWLALFWAARRGVPMRPRLTGGIIAIAALCFAITVALISGSIYLIVWELGATAIAITLSAGAGSLWLDPELLSREDKSQRFGQLTKIPWVEARVIFPVAAALSAGLLIFVLRLGVNDSEPVHDFDLAIQTYQESLASFQPNVPSASVETVLAAYIERGMPSYMWDFGPQGFKLVGGRFERLADGTPVTYTWFRSTKAGMMCMFKQVSGFKPPAAVHLERDHLLFYRYRDYSVCLVDVGGYSDFISVIVSPLPTKTFMHLVLAALGTDAKGS